MTTTTADHSLTLGSLLLTDSVEDPDHGFVFNVLASGMSTGSGAAVKEIVTSLLADGDLVRITRYGNREVSFSVEITGPTLGALAHGEAALRAEVGGGNTLTWQAPDVLSVPTVFEVAASEMAQTFDDLDELRRRRTFMVSLTCSPAARSADAVTVEAIEAPPVTPTTVTVNAADATAGWSVNSGSSLVDAGTYLTASTTGSLLTLVLTLAPFNLTGTPYVTVEMAGSVPTYFSVDTGSGPVAITPWLARATGTGTVLYVFEVGEVDLYAISVTRKGSPVGGAGGFHTFHMHDVSATDTPPQVSPRQITRVIEVGGTERTPASIHVQSEDGIDALGQCIVHTCPEDGSGYSPPLVRWRVSGSGSGATDATAFSGEYEVINTTSWVAEVPTSALPEGGYILVARLRAQTAGVVSITWSTSTIFPDAVTQQGFTVGAFNHDFAVGNEWEIVPIEVLSLPSVRTKAGKVQIALQVAAASPVVTLDEAWLFRDDDDCALTIVETDQPHLWLDSPDLDSPVPRVWIDDGDATRVHPGEGLKAMGAHVLSPEGTAVFTAALTDYPLTDATFYRRWHSNAAS
jgi:hypothetical protein